MIFGMDMEEKTTHKVTYLWSFSHSSIPLGKNLRERTDVKQRNLYKKDQNCLVTSFSLEE